MKLIKTWLRREIEITPKELEELRDADVQLGVAYTVIEILRFIKSFNK